MGKTGKWFRSLLGSKKSAAAEEPPSTKKKKSKWGFSKSGAHKLKSEDPLASPYLDANKHAIAVAAATAAVAEAALAAAHAAAEVVRLTTAPATGRNPHRRHVAAVIKIQSAFRAYLARRALRALKGLVKLQALVRGHIVRKQSADMLRRMQAMARIQARASSHRSYATDNCQPNIKFSNYQPSGVVNPRNYPQWPDTAKHGGYIVKSRMSNIVSEERSHMGPNWLNHWVEQHSWNDRIRGDDERSDKILEVDTWKPRQSTRRSDRAFPRNEAGQECPRIISLPRLSAKLEKPNPSISSEEVSSVMSAKEVEQAAVWTAESSPRVQSASSRPNTNFHGMFTPTRSECSRSLYGDYLGHPNYMAYTESSRAKVRSQSAPKQRMQLDELGVSSTFGRNVWESDATSEKGYAVLANHRSPAYVNRRAPGAPGVLSSSYGYRF